MAKLSLRSAMPCASPAIQPAPVLRPPSLSNRVLTLKPLALQVRREAKLQRGRLSQCAASSDPTEGLDSEGEVSTSSASGPEAEPEPEPAAGNGATPTPSPQAGASSTTSASATSVITSPPATSYSSSDAGSSYRQSTPAGDSESREVLDAFFLGRALAEVVVEKVGSAVGEFLSDISRAQAEQQQIIRQLQDEVTARAAAAQEKAKKQ